MIRLMTLALLVGWAHAAPLPMVAAAVDLEPDPDVVRVELTAAPMPDGSDSFVFAYNGQTPGPTIEAKVGDILVVELTNGLDSPTTIHWHGLHVPWAMDGVAWMADPVMPGDTFTYQFALEQAGTFWYHPHFDTNRQVDGGLYGALVVTDPAEPVVDGDLVLVFDLPEEHHAEEEAHEEPAYGHGRLFPQWRVNGALAPADWTLRGGTTTRVRVLNVSSTGYLALDHSGLRQIGGDQGLLSAENRRSPVVLAPGDRVELAVAAGDEPVLLRSWPYSLNGGAAYGPDLELVQFSIVEPAERPAPVDWGHDGPAATVDPGRTDIYYVFTGSDRSDTWYINGEQFPEVTIEALALGDSAIIELRNVSPTNHPFHLHGHSFEVLSVNGVVPAARVIEDTIDVPIHGTVRLRMVANNPGDWMVHCHILPHVEHGMMTVLRVR